MSAVPACQTLAPAADMKTKNRADRSGAVLAGAAAAAPAPAAGAAKPAAGGAAAKGPERVQLEQARHLALVLWPLWATLCMACCTLLQIHSAPTHVLPQFRQRNFFTVPHHPPTPHHSPPLAKQDRKWMVENQEGNREIVIEQTQPHQTVYIYNCANSVVQVGAHPCCAPPQAFCWQELRLLRLSACLLPACLVMHCKAASLCCLANRPHPCNRPEIQCFFLPCSNDCRSAAMLTPSLETPSHQFY